MEKQIGKIMKTIFKIGVSIAATVLLCTMIASCSDDYIIGGDVNETNVVNMNTFDYLKGQAETKVVAELFERAGLKDVINRQDITIIAPNEWSVNRYLRRRYNQELRVDPTIDPLTIDDISQTDLLQMGMYIIPGFFDRETVPEEGLIVTAYDGSKIYIAYDEVNMDPGSAGDYAYQYSYFMQQVPRVLHVHFKRGNNWEWTTSERSSLTKYYDNPECDHVYRVYVSDVITTNGVVHILYQGDYNFSDHYYYHSLFFFGTRDDDKF